MHAVSGFASAAGAKGRCPLDSRASAASGRALPCTRDFFVKKSSKNFIPPAGGTEKFARIPSPIPLRWII
ncbi:hypothetical protein D7X33_07050 [Butyricicoccus sp. 1XD8-22]|nr:hypothetical protein D7X33_07050 [Butyricicoccus sp. 1XD8-22]